MAGGEGRSSANKSGRVTSKTSAKQGRVEKSVKTTAKTSRLAIPTPTPKPAYKDTKQRGRDNRSGSTGSSGSSSSKKTKKDPWAGLRTVSKTGKSSGSKATGYGSSFKSNISSQRR